MLGWRREEEETAVLCLSVCRRRAKALGADGCCSIEAAAKEETALGAGEFPIQF